MNARTGWLVEILLPLAYNNDAPIPDDLLASVRNDLVAQFGGLTAFTRSPAEGIWVSDDAPHRDDIVVLEVMTDGLDRAWWASWRARVERLLRQEEIVVRAREIERL
jgi:hypothetical protein